MEIKRLFPNAMKRIALQGHGEIFWSQDHAIRGRPYKNYRVPKAAMAEHRIRLRPDRSLQKQRSGGEGDGDTIPFATLSVGFFSGEEVGQSTVMREPAVVPLTSCNGFPVSTSLKTGGQSLKSKVPL